MPPSLAHRSSCATVVLGALTYEYEPTTGLLAVERAFGANGAVEHSVAYAYDAAGRIVRELHTLADTGETRTVEYEYDGGPGQRGHLTRVRGPLHEARTRYNPDGTVANTTIDLAGWRSVSIDTDYYAGGQVHRTRRIIRDLEQDGAILQELEQEFRHDDHGRLRALAVNGGKLAGLLYDTEGRLDRVHLVSGQLLVYSYDAVTHKPNGYWHDTGAWNAGVEWTLDARGHVVREDISVNGAYRHRDYTYDPRGFLVATAEVSRTAHYSYTAAGLMAMAKDELGLRTVHPGAAQSFLVGTNIYEYDDLGRVVRKGDIELAYGPDGQLASARRGNDEWTYAYDQHGNRLLKLHNGHPVAAYIDGSYITADRIITPVRVAGRLIGVLEGNEFHLLAVDPRGTVLSDRDGTPRPASAYGVRTTRPDLAEALDYVEKSYDPVLGTVRMGVRDYDPLLGQFLTPDPLFFADPTQCIASPVECNLYGYAKNNPLRYIDPNGLGVRDFLVDFATGVGETAWEAGTGLVAAASDPIGTVKGIGYAVTHPVQTTSAVWVHSKQTVSSCLAGNGNACGRVGSEAFTLVVGSGAAWKLRKVSKAAEAARTADRVSDATRVVAREAPRALPAARQVEAVWGASSYRHGGRMTGVEHIMYRHSAHSGFANVSRFAEGTTARDIASYVDDTLRYGRVTPNGAGAFTIEYNLGRPIGTNVAGETTTWIRVHVRDGVIQTAFPF